MDPGSPSIFEGESLKSHVLCALDLQEGLI